jgi:hypothetical protein
MHFPVGLLPHPQSIFNTPSNLLARSNYNDLKINKEISNAEKTMFVTLLNNIRSKRQCYGNERQH